MKKIFYVLPLVLSTANSYAVDARSYNILPKDLNLAELSYVSVSTEKELLNSAKVDHDSQSLNARYLRTFGIGDTLAAAYIQVPYFKNDATVNLGPMKINDKKSGLGDTKLFFAIGTYNMPALSKEEYSKYDKNGTRSACSAAFTIPTGSYEEKNLFNVGTNLYSLKGECVVGYVNNGFVAEFLTSATTYSNDTNVAGTKKRTQKDMYQSEVHVTYNVTPKFWTGVEAYYQNGGEQLVNGISSQDKLNNTMIGAVANYNFGQGRYFKANYIKTVSSPKYAAKSDYLVFVVQQLF
jgi:hypothetical protein